MQQPKHTAKAIDEKHLEKFTPQSLKEKGNGGVHKQKILMAMWDPNVQFKCEKRDRSSALISLPSSTPWIWIVDVQEYWVLRVLKVTHFDIPSILLGRRPYVKESTQVTAIDD
nr:hypothetical protein Iba_chr07cCG5340 [Ipomoea batatas]